MKILIQGGRVMDPASGLDEKTDLALVDSAVVAIKSIANRATIIKGGTSETSSLQSCVDNAKNKPNQTGI